MNPLLLLFVFFTLSPALPAISNFTVFSRSYLSKRDVIISCFDGEQDLTNPLLRPRFPDCVNAAVQMVKGDKVDAPMQFSRTTGYILPDSWTFGNCAIAIDMMGPDDSDTVPLKEVARAAMAVMVACVQNVRSPQLGGKSTAGPEQVIRVEVVYKMPLPAEYPPLYRVGQATGMIETLTEDMSPGGQVAAITNTAQLKAANAKGG
ncbi:hypothetical protein MMC06_002361 [Schaereria dolodes]|nr:hypothetical protein [Schaereria dolodes]